VIIGHVMLKIHVCSKFISCFAFCRFGCMSINIQNHIAGHV